ncbi:hypothetical protein GQ55_7G087200 [Panicum hallii var. hallii]|uniref:Uncharacterized protein n=1 Tax=Panicum hallii var. hallii TaxID=1504633 RepID=A0A2T7CT49_9POAL|nr:hypothetical protein GQ55_7G087200 [Panicum hallii var. hallii]
MPYAPYPTSFHPYSSWGWNDPWAHAPSYRRPYDVEYAAPREPSCARQRYVESDHFEHKDRSRVQNKKKVVKQVYRVKRDGCKDTSSDLNTIDEKPINVLRTSAIDGKGREKSSVDIPSVKSKQSRLKELKIKKELLLSRTEAKPSHPLAKGAIQLKGKRKSERRFSSMRFAPNHRNYWSLHHLFDLQMSYMPMSWNSSLGMFGYTSHFYFDPWFNYGSLYLGGSLPNFI